MNGEWDIIKEMLNNLKKETEDSDLIVLFSYLKRNEKQHKGLETCHGLYVIRKLCMNKLLI